MGFIILVILCSSLIMPWLEVKLLNLPMLHYSYVSLVYSVFTESHELDRFRDVISPDRALHFHMLVMLGVFLSPIASLPFLAEKLDFLPVAWRTPISQPLTHIVVLGAVFLCNVYAITTWKWFVGAGVYACTLALAIQLLLALRDLSKPHHTKEVV
jgi:hypothetical protein